MACQGCEKFDSYESQGGEKHWFDFGYCHKCGVTKHKADACEVDHIAPKDLKLARAV